MPQPCPLDVSLYLRDLTTHEISANVAGARIVLLPVGSIEQHGAHLPIDTDLRIVEYLANMSLQSARTETEQVVGFIAPPLPFGGPTLGMQEWPGTMTLTSASYIEVISALAAGLARAKFRYIVVLNGCMGNSPALQLAIQKAKTDEPQAEFILVEGFWSASETIENIRESDTGGTGHAGEIETSIMLSLAPDLVRMDLAEFGPLNHPSPRAIFDIIRTGPFYWPIPFGQLMKNGVIGDPALATAEKGRLILGANIERIKSILLHLYELGEE